MEEKLEELVEIFKERKTVTKILEAKNVRAAYQKEKKVLEQKLNKFNYVVRKQGRRFQINFYEEVICPENIVDIYFILIMARLNDTEVFRDWDIVAKNLLDVVDSTEEVAQRIYNLVIRQHKNLSSFTEEQILKILLFK